MECKIFNIYLNIAAEKPFSGSAINVYVCMYVCNVRAGLGLRGRGDHQYAFK